ncbi:MAG: penicillin acylase family protein [Telluria sp.]
MHPIRLWLLLGLVVIAACTGQERPRDPDAGYRFAAQLGRSSHGMVHVTANDFRGIGYGLAYAYAQDNVCMFADTLLTVRGERSRWFGPTAHATRSANGEYGAVLDYLDLPNDQSDFFFKGYLDLDALRQGYAAASQDARDLLDGYAAGYNRYLRDAAGRLPSACHDAGWVKPVTAEDMYLVIAEKALHASGEVFAAEFVAAGRGAPLISAQPAPPIADKLAALHGSLGSNALALGQDVTAHGRGILLGNPHYPWTSTDRFYQAHLVVPGRYDAEGVILGGIPIIVIGFNQDVAWTHTVTTALHFTTFRLDLDPADASSTTYLVDGVRTAMTSRLVSIDVLQADGTLAKRSRTFFFTKYGPVIVKPEAGVNWTANNVFVLGDPNRANTRLIDQWLGIGRARSVEELKASLDAVAGLPWINTVAADRNGHTLYADASVVPHVTGEQFGNGCLVAPAMLGLDGSRSACAWGQDAGAPPGIFSPKNAPSLQRSDYVANSNDSYWLTNPHQLLTGFSPMYGPVNVEQKLRTRIGFRQVEDLLAATHAVTAEDVEQLAFANRVYAAELVVPQLAPACQGSSEALLRQACVALASWDLHADLDSRGAVLFREFWNSAAHIPDKWQVPLNPADPVNTPNTVRPSALPAMVVNLRAAAAKLSALGIPFDAALGDYQDDTRNGVRVAIHGAIGDIDGSYNSVHLATPLDSRGYHNVVWGTSYVQVVQFEAGGPVARGMLVYGQSTDPASPYYADQVPVYSRKEWPALPFSAQAIQSDPAYRPVRLRE